MIEILKDGPFALNCREIKKFKKGEIVKGLGAKAEETLISAGWAQPKKEESKKSKGKT